MLNEQIEIIPTQHIEYSGYKEILWSSCKDVVPVLVIGLTLAVTIEVVVKFFLLGRRKKKIEKMIEEKMSELKEQEKLTDDAFWEYVRSKLNGL